MKILLRFALIYFVSFFPVFNSNGQAPAFRWANHLEATMNMFGPDKRLMSVDDSGNVFYTGVFTGTIDVDPGPAINSITAAGDYAVFISKLDSSGNFLWAEQVAGFYIESNGIATDASGNVYVSGTFVDVMDFDPGPGVFNLATNGSGDAFVLKLDATGNFEWARSMGSGSSDTGFGVAVDAWGNVIINGWFSDVMDCDPGPGVYNLNAISNSQDVFVCKLDNGGNFVWAAAFTGPESNWISKIITDQDGNIYTAGGFAGDVDFDPGISVHQFTAASNQDMFVVKLNSLGAFQWVATFGDEIGNFYMGMAVDGSQNVYISGAFGNSADFDPGAGVFNMSSAGDMDAFLVKLNMNGSFGWAKQFGSSGFDFARDLNITQSGNLIIGGVFTGTVDFDPGSGSSFHTSNGDIGGFATQWDINGGFQWAISLGDAGNTYIFQSISDSHGNSWLFGLFDSPIDLDPGAGVLNTIPVSSMDWFTVKLGASSVGIAETRGENLFQVYPNPSNGFLHISHTAITGPIVATVSDLAGKVVSSFILETGCSVLELKGAPGVYVVEVIADDRSLGKVRVVKFTEK